MSVGIPAQRLLVVVRAPVLSLFHSDALAQVHQRDCGSADFLLLSAYPIGVSARFFNIFSFVDGARPEFHTVISRFWPAGTAENAVILSSIPDRPIRRSAKLKSPCFYEVTGPKLRTRPGAPPSVPLGEPARCTRPNCCAADRPATFGLQLRDQVNIGGKTRRNSK